MVSAPCFVCFGGSVCFLHCENASVRLCCFWSSRSSSPGGPHAPDAQVDFSRPALFAAIAFKWTAELARQSKWDGARELAAGQAGRPADKQIDKQTDNLALADWSR